MQIWLFGYIQLSQWVYLGSWDLRMASNFWLIWHTYQWAYAIMICPSCVVVIVIVCVCCCHCHCHCLCTAVPVIALIIASSYLAHICTYIWSICTWNIRSIWCIFLTWQLFYFYLLKASLLFQKWLYCCIFSLSGNLPFYKELLTM